MKPKQYLLWTCALLLILSTSCERGPEIDNSGIVLTPYVLHTGKLNGEIHKTNDGSYFDKYHPIDKVPVRQIITADTNVLALKRYFHLKDGDGGKFNVTNQNTLDYFDLQYNYFMPHQMLYHKVDNVVYLCTKGGLMKSDDLGKTFQNTGIAAVPKSVIELDNGDVIAIQDDATIFENPNGILGFSQVTAGTSVLTPGSNYYLSKKGNTVIATDYDGTMGVSYSVDNGANWTKYGGVSGNGSNILFVNQPEGSDDLFMGRDQSGLFKLNSAGTTFEASGTGIPWNARVHYIVGKKLVFRTEAVRYYLYCATDLGLYVSESGGDDWSLVPTRTGDYSTLH